MGGGHLSILKESNTPIVRAMGDGLCIAEGLLADRSLVHKFGKNTDVDSGSVPEDIVFQGGTYTGFPVSDSETVEVFSADATDTAAGTGARTIEIFGLGDDWASQSETITLNGLTGVNSANSYRRVFRAIVRTAGSNGANAGNLTIRHSTTTANVFAVIDAGINQTQNAAYTIPANTTGYLIDAYVGVRGNNAVSVDGQILYRSSGGLFRPRLEFKASNSSAYIQTIYGGLELTEKSDIVMRITGTGGANNVSVLSNFTVVLKEN